MMDSGNSDGGLSPASYESDTAGGMEWSEDGHVRPLEPMTQNGGPKITPSGKVRPDLPLYRPPPVRGPQQEAINGLRNTGWGSVGRTTRSSPLEGRSITWCPGGRPRRNWGEASATASQGSMLRGLPCAAQPRLNQGASTQSHDATDPDQTISEPKTVPGFMSSARASGVAMQPHHSPHDIESSQEPYPLWRSGSVVLHPTPSPEIHGGEGAGNRPMRNYKRWKEELNIDSLPCRANDYKNAFYNQFCLVEAIVRTLPPFLCLATDSKCRPLISPRANDLLSWAFDRSCMNSRASIRKPPSTTTTLSTRRTLRESPVYRSISRRHNQTRTSSRTPFHRSPLRPPSWIWCPVLPAKYPYRRNRSNSCLPFQNSSLRTRFPGLPVEKRRCPGQTNNQRLLQRLLFPLIPRRLPPGRSVLLQTRSHGLSVYPSGRSRGVLIASTKDISIVTAATPGWASTRESNSATNRA